MHIMGGNNSRPRMYGAFTFTGERLFEEGILVINQGDIHIARSKDLKVSISSYKYGIFRLRFKYIGGLIRVCY